MKRWAISLVIFAVTSSTAFAEVLKQEPKMGDLKENQVVLVDDGSCPAGQIKRVVGGNHVKATGTKYIERKRTCVPR
jgi:hypothetical protein